MIKLYFPIEPIAKARPRVTRRGHCYTPQKTKDFEETLKSLAILQMHENKHSLLEGVLSARVFFFLNRPKKPKHGLPAVKPDIDNLVKSLFDALNEVVWKDDAQVCTLSVTKLYSEKPSISIEIRHGYHPMSWL